VKTEGAGDESAAADKESVEDEKDAKEDDITDENK